MLSPGGCGRALLLEATPLAACRTVKGPPPSAPSALILLRGSLPPPSTAPCLLPHLNRPDHLHHRVGSLHLLHQPLPAAQHGVHIPGTRRAGGGWPAYLACSPCFSSQGGHYTARMHRRGRAGGQEGQEGKGRAAGQRPACLRRPARQLHPACPPLPPLSVPCPRPRMLSPALACARCTAAGSAAHSQRQQSP